MEHVRGSVYGARARERVWSTCEGGHIGDTCKGGAACHRHMQVRPEMGSGQLHLLGEGIRVQ